MWIAELGKGAAFIMGEQQRRIYTTKRNCSYMN